MKNFTRILAALAAAAMVLTGCEPEAQTVKVTGVTLNKSTLGLTEGETETLIATVAPDDAENKAVTWDSSNKTVATVSGGTVTALKEGSTTITVTTVDGDQTDTCIVTVSAPEPEYPVTGKAGTLDWSLERNGTLTISGEGAIPDYVKPSATGGTRATDPAPWASYSDEIIAVIIVEGVTAIGDNAFAGLSALESVTLPDTVATIGEGAFEGCAELAEITIPDGTEIGEGAFDGCDSLPDGVIPVPVTGVTITPGSLNLTVGETGTLTATVVPADADNKNVVWESIDQTVATVVNGTVTALKEGSTTITVTTVEGGKTDLATVTVNAAPTYTIAAAPDNLGFGTLRVGYAEAPDAQTVTITNTGTGAVTLTAPTATAYTLGALSATELAAGASATFTVQPKAGLDGGTHNETITVAGTNGTTASVVARFTVDDSDITKPTVVSVTPSGTDTPLEGNIVVTFSEAMDTEWPGTVTLTDSNGTFASGLSAAGRWSNEGKTYTVAYSGLAYGMEYTVRISVFRDAAANEMDYDMENSFTTVAAPGNDIEFGGEKETNWP